MSTREDLESALNSGVTEIRSAVDGDVAQAMVSCMKRAGFEYVIHLHDADQNDPSGVFDEASARTWGFGVSTRWIPASQTPHGLRGSPAGAPAADGDDPNAGYVASLSRDGRQRYMQALDGDAGCRREAASANPVGRFLAAFEVAMFDLEKLVQADPAVVEHVASATACVARQIPEFIDLETELQSINAEMNALVDQLEYGPNSAILWLDSQVDAFASIQQHEIAVAVVSLSCALVGPEFRRIEAAARRVYLHDFMETRAADVDRLLSEA